MWNVFFCTLWDRRHSLFSMQRTSSLSEWYCTVLKFRQVLIDSYCWCLVFFFMRCCCCCDEVVISARSKKNIKKLKKSYRVIPPELYRETSQVYRVICLMKNKIFFWSLCNFSLRRVGKLGKWRKSYRVKPLELYRFPSRLK